MDRSDTNRVNVRGFVVVLLGLVLAACAAAMQPGVMTGQSGMTVYTFDHDSPGSGTSACTGGCSKAWPPVPAGDVAGAGIGSITRPDGTQQATYAGKPLYYYAGDSKPGDKNGDGVAGVWHAVSASSSGALSSGY